MLVCSVMQWWWILTLQLVFTHNRERPNMPASSFAVYNLDIYWHFILNGIIMDDAICIFSFASFTNHCCFHLMAFQFARYGRSNSMSHSNIAALWNKTKTLWSVEHTVQAALMNFSLSMGSTSSLPSNWTVQSILPSSPYLTFHYSICSFKTSTYMSSISKVGTTDLSIKQYIMKLLLMCLLVILNRYAPHDSLCLWLNNLICWPVGIMLNRRLLAFGNDLSRLMPRMENATTVNGSGYCYMDQAPLN